MKLGRVICSKFWAPLVLLLGLVTPAKGQPAAVSAPAANPLPPTNLVAGPSLYETGKVGLLPDGAPNPAPTPVPAELQWAGNSEKSIKPGAADLADAPPPRPPEGTIDPVRLAGEVEANGLINFGFGFLFDLNGPPEMRWFKY